MSLLPAGWRVSNATCWAVAALLVVVGVVLFRVWRPENTPLDSAISLGDHEIVAPVIANPGYLGPQACAECHAERVAEFRETRHFLANRVPDPRTMPSGFQSGQGDLPVPAASARFEMTEANGGFLQKTFQESTPQSAPVSSPITYVYGAAGGNDEVYFSSNDEGRLRELPMVWLAPQKEWGTSLFDRHGHGDFSRETTIRCVECHNTWFEYVPGSRNQYRHDNAMLGVTCEVCHGPGKDHVAFHREQPKIREPHAIVQPATLSRERLMDLCSQCHSNAMKHRGPAFRYRPGQPLDDFYVTMTTKHPEDDHVANQTTYLRESRCFQNSDSLTCVTCHNPHQPRSISNAGTTSCRNCHAVDECKDRHQFPTAVQDDCIGCHMPERRKIQVFFQTRNDKYVSPVKRYEHKIGVYSWARQSVLLEWYRSQTDPVSRDKATQLEIELSESWLKEAEALQAAYRFLAAIDACRESLRFRLSPPVQEKLQQLIQIQSQIDADFQLGQWHEREGRYPAAIEAFQRTLVAKPDFAQGHSRLGTTYAVVGEKELAREHLLAAMRFDTNDPYAPTMLGWLEYLGKNFQQALVFYDQADAVEPSSAKINYQIGLTLTGLDRWSEARTRFMKAVEIDPHQVEALLELSRCCSRLGQLPDALAYGRRAVDMSHSENPVALLNLADLCAASGRWKEAIEIAEKALSVAHAQRSERETSIRIRLDELRTRRQKRQ